MSMPILLDLPPELLYLVVDYLRDDRSSLHAVALSHRAFLPATRSLTWRKLKLDRASGPRFGAAAAEWPWAPSLVVEMSIDKGGWRLDQQGLAHTRSRWMWRDMEPVLSPLTNRFEALIKLEVSRLDWETMRPSIRSFFRAQFANLIEIHIFDCDMSAMDLCDLQLLANTPRIKFTEVIWPHVKPENADQSHRLRKRVESLHLSGTHLPHWKALLWLFSEQDDLSQLTAIVVDRLHHKDTPLLGRLIYQTHEMLEVLDLSQATAEILDAMPALVLRQYHFPRLRKLGLGVMFKRRLRPIPDILSAWGNRARAKDEPPRPTLRALAIGHVHEQDLIRTNATLIDPNDLPLIKARYNFGAIDEAMGKPAFSLLDQVELRLLTRFYDPEVLGGTLSELLPRTDARGILRYLGRNVSLEGRV